MLSRNPATAYRRVALEARIEASGSADLTRICLEEAAAAVAQAKLVLPRSSTGYREPLTRAQTIMVWLAQSVAPEHPLRASLKAFYGGLASQIGAQIQHADAHTLEAIRNDINEVLEAAG
jgi:flagellin-specific chaperone FliS